MRANSQNPSFRGRGKPSISDRGRGRGRGYGRNDKAYGGGNQGPIELVHERNNSTANRIGYVEEMNSHMPERFRKSKNKDRQYGNDWSLVDQRDPGNALNTSIRQYIQEQQEVASTNDKEKWLDMPEIPTSDELHLSDDTIVDLLPNKIHDKFKSVRSYLKTHYQLLREDATSPLRDAIDKYRKDPSTMDDQDLSVYEKVHISGFTFTRNGIAARVKFSTRRAGRRILWAASKRLVSGTLLALTPANDNFSTRCIVAIVAARPAELLERSPPEVDIYFSRPEDIQIDPQVEYVMIESKQGYYEAYRHTLKGMQKLSRESFSLSPHIVGSDTAIGPPHYLLETPKRSLCAASTDEADFERLTSIDLIEKWPEKPPSTTLDRTQWDALQQILTKKLAIIQGPPGTGKTYVSKVALQIMSLNRKEDDPPIIIAAQTNHALDQLLKHVSSFDPNYIRLGGRSTNLEVKKQALFEVTQRERIPPIPGSLYGPAKKRLEAECTKYGDVLSIFAETHEPISCDTLLKLGVINAAQKKSLVDAAANLVTADEDIRNPMQYWLNKVLLPFEVDYGDDTFGFEDVEDDLEFEQLKEVEAEHGLADEEDIEMLKGPWIPVFDNTTIAQPSDVDLEKAKRMLSTKQDLWTIPEYLRAPTYFIMKQKAKALNLLKFQELAKEYDRVAQQLKIGKWERDAVYLKRANIVGMTTTGLSKYRPLISSLKPKIVLIEEAAEVLEGPVTAACMESVEHLILVGDHQQLQGHCSVSELEDDPYYLNISMFERLVNLNMPFRTLLRQRRMNPEIRTLVSSLYPGLEDHEDVLNRQPLPVWGTGSVRSFFFSHDSAEQKDESLSTYNEAEAQLVAKFYRHLLRHGVPPAAITILTFYNGQRKRILRELKNDPETNLAYNLVKTVDSYQGEENEIIILSLVRSNEDHKIGFLEVDNRVCVALSRARHGLYLFGNGSLLAEQSELWSKVESLMSSSQPRRIGGHLPLTCVKHNQTIYVQYAGDFDEYEGGCQSHCGEQRSCGHICTRKCHPQPHALLDCLSDCNIRLLCGHMCSHKCGQSCYCDCADFDEFAQWNVGSAARQIAPIDRADAMSGSLSYGGTISDGVSQAETASEVDTNDGLTSGRSSRALARGGAAFHPQSVPYQYTIRDLIEERPGAIFGVDTVESRASRSTWSSFANGSAQKEDKRHAAVQATTNNLQHMSLLDIAPHDTSGTLESSVSETTSDGRSRYTQYYQPAIPGRSEPPNISPGSSSTMQRIQTSEMPSLLD